MDPETLILNREVKSRLVERESSADLKPRLLQSSLHSWWIFNRN